MLGNILLEVTLFSQWILPVKLEWQMSLAHAPHSDDISLLYEYNLPQANNDIPATLRVRSWHLDVDI